MPNLNYKNGRAFEYRVKKHYEQAGFTCVRMAGSHSPTDLIAWKDSPGPHGVDIVFIQCKKGAKKGYASAKDALRKLPGPPWIRRVLWENVGKKTYMHDLACEWREEVRLNGKE